MNNEWAASIQQIGTLKTLLITMRICTADQNHTEINITDSPTYEAPLSREVSEHVMQNSSTEWLEIR